MRKLITAPLAVTALVAALSNIAAADPTSPATTAAAAPVAQARLNQNAAGVSRVAMPPATPADPSGIDRTFHPDYSQALSVNQMTAAWNGEIDRVFETPVTGGG